MKILQYIGFTLFLIAFSAIEILSQDCKKFYLYGSCMQYPGAYFKIDGQSRSNIIGTGDKLIYNVIFQGERDYKLYFCATDKFLPVHYILKDPDTKELIFDSKNNDYIETIELKIETTRKILIEISVLALKGEKEIVENYFGCVGFLMNWKPVKKK